TVLLVHDGQLTRDLIAERLRAEGYAVLAASSGHIAQRLAGAHRGRIDLIITALSLPDSTGAALVDAVRSARGRIPDIYIATGDDARGDAPPAPPEGAAMFSSPVSLDDLLGAVRTTQHRPH